MMSENQEITILICCTNHDFFWYQIPFKLPKNVAELYNFWL